MKCYSVNIMTLKGEYKSVYVGGDLSEAKKVRKEYNLCLSSEEAMEEKDCIAVFYFPRPYSKRVSGKARHMHALDKAKKAEKREEAKTKESAPKSKKKEAK